MSGLWTVDCGLRPAHAHALLVLLMPDGPACVMAMVIVVPLSGNGVCPYIHAYIHAYIHTYTRESTIRFMYGHLSTSYTTTHIHIHTRLTPAPSRSHSHQGSPLRRHPPDKKAPHRHGDRALGGTAQQISIPHASRRRPRRATLASHTLHSPPPSTRAARAPPRPVDSSPVGPSASCID